MTSAVSGDFAHFFRKATGTDPFPYQERLAGDPELPQLVRAPTGSGKTAAAVLGWLYRLTRHPDPRIREATPRRLVYCLPMRVLVEQTVGCVRAWVQSLGLTEEVGVFQLMGGVVEDDWVRSPQKHTVLVGTMDMLLSRAMNRGYAARRFRWPMDFGLLNNDSLWVLDEVQLMGNGLATSAQLAAFRAALGTVRPCPSIWMSATVAAEWLGTVDHPAPAHELTVGEADLATGLGVRVRARKRLQRLSVAGWPDGGERAVLDLHRPGTLTLVVVNTVDRALRLAQRTRRAAPKGLEVLLAHSRFRPPDRRRVVQQLLSEPPEEGRVVVATQVVEAGIDLSAATLVTEVAPWSSLVQRFGRVNRFGEHTESQVAWVDLPERHSAPYDPAEVEEGRARLEELDGGSVGPDALERLGPGEPPRTTHVIRRPDLLDLFDTEPDLAGNDVDVSRFIRDDAEVDVNVFWRRLPSAGTPGPDEPRPAPDELCAVPVGEIRKFLEPRGGRPGVRAFVWDHLDGVWRRATSADVRPGMTLLLPADAGAYTTDTGWDPRSTAPVDPLPATEVPAEQEEAVEDDAPEEVTGEWITLPEHLSHVREALEALLSTYRDSLEDWEFDALLEAAQWHDVGKAHPQFQEAVLSRVDEPERSRRASTLWAKTPYPASRYERRHFRHELASALALLAAPESVSRLTGRALNLAAYLVAAHHGKARLAIRPLPGEKRPDGPTGRRFARGVWDGDTLGPVSLDGRVVPQVSLDLSILEVGRREDGSPSWTERVLELRDRLGPFRLAFLEALLRVADWEASARESRRMQDV